MRLLNHYNIVSNLIYHKEFIMDHIKQFINKKYVNSILKKSLCHICG